MKDFIERINYSDYPDICNELRIIMNYVKNNYYYIETNSFKDEDFYNSVLNKAIKILRLLNNKGKLNIIDDNFIKETEWLTTVGNYLDVLYAIYNKEEYIKENENDYLFYLSSIIMKSTIVNLEKTGSNYDKYFNKFKAVLLIYKSCFKSIVRDIHNGLINKTEGHFIEIVLSTFLAYYYSDYDNISIDKVNDTISMIFDYRNFLESLEVKGFNQKTYGNYSKEKYIAKYLINNINTKRIKVK